MDNLEFLDGGEPPIGEAAPAIEAPAAVEAAAEPVTPEAVAEEPKGPVRGPDGKFAKKEADEPVMVPLKALHETRDELKALKAQIEAQARPQTQQQPQVPDMFEDPEGYQRHIAGSFQQALYQERLNSSQRFAVQQFGIEAVAQAMEWGQALCAQDPNFNAAVMASPDPVGYAVQLFQRQQVLDQVGNDPKQLQAFLAWQQAQQAQPQPAATAAPSQPQRPTGSIASAVSAGGAQHTATGPGVAFDNVIR